MRNWAWYRGNAANLLTMACQMSVVTLLPLYWKRHGLEDYEIGWLAAGLVQRWRAPLNMPTKPTTAEGR